MSAQHERTWRVAHNGRETLVQLLHDLTHDRIEILVGGFPSPFRSLSNNAQEQRIELYIAGRAAELIVRTTGKDPDYELRCADGASAALVAVPSSSTKADDRKSLWKSVSALLGGRAATAR